MILKKGTRVLYNGDKAKIILIDNIKYPNRCKIMLFYIKNISDINVRTWVSSSDLELDIEFYRDKKLNKLLK